MAGYPGYVTPLKSMLVEAVQLTFDPSFPDPDFRSINVGIEFPVAASNYPGIWLDYDDTAPLQNAGIAHYENTLPALDGTSTTLLRWRFQGYASFTVVALSSLERDRLYDQLISVLAFGRQNPITSRFRATIENNDLIACNFDFDTVQGRGNNAAPGTPWGSEEFIYEKTINVDVLGEFTSDPGTGLLVPLSKIVIVPGAVVTDGQFPPFTPGALVSDWH